MMHVFAKSIAVVLSVTPAALSAAERMSVADIAYCSVATSLYAGMLPAGKDRTQQTDFSATLMTFAQKRASETGIAAPAFNEILLTAKRQVSADLLQGKNAQENSANFANIADGCSSDWLFDSL